MSKDNFQRNGIKKVLKISIEK